MWDVSTIVNRENMHVYWYFDVVVQFFTAKRRECSVLDSFSSDCPSKVLGGGDCSVIEVYFYFLEDGFGGRGGGN